MGIELCQFHKYEQMQIGQRLRDKRKALGWTQGVAAQKIGIQQSYLSKLENNQFIPSQEVLEQLNQVYELDLILDSGNGVDAQRNSTSLIVALLTLCIAVATVIIAQTGLVFSQTYYTYEAKPLGDIKEQVLLSYELTDEYRGEAYQTKFAGQVYKYQLLGERKISRKENIWLTLISAFLGFLSCSYLVYRRFTNRITS